MKTGLFNTLAFVLLGAGIPGCSGTDAYVTSLYELSDARSFVLSTHADQTVWLVSSGQVSKLGALPYSVSQSRKMVVASDFANPNTLIARKELGPALRISVTPDTQRRITDLRCDDNSIIARVSQTSNDENKNSNSWVRISIPELTKVAATDAEWRAMCSANPVPSRQELTDDEKTTVFALDEHRAIVRRFSPGKRATISMRNQNGVLTLLLRESLGSFLARRLANTGLQYP